MDLISGTDDEYNFSGPIPDVWFALQVSHSQHYQILIHRSIPSLQFLEFQLQRFLNFTYVLKKPKDNAYGRENEDGTWTGMIGEVKRGEADMGNYLQLSFK